MANRILSTFSPIALASVIVAFTSPRLRADACNLANFSGHAWLIKVVAVTPGSALQIVEEHVAPVTLAKPDEQFKLKPHSDYEISYLEDTKALHAMSFLLVDDKGTAVLVTSRRAGCAGSNPYLQVNQVAGKTIDFLPTEPYLKIASCLGLNMFGPGSIVITLAAVPSLEPKPVKRPGSLWIDP